MLNHRTILLENEMTDEKPEGSATNSALEERAASHNPFTDTSGLSRRSLFSAGAVGLLLGAAACNSNNVNGGLPIGPTGAPSPPPAKITDVDILNFALNLEYLEAEFYYHATTGHGIAAAGIGTSGTGKRGPTTGGQKTDFTNKTTQSVAAQITSDEGAHVTLLRSALGAKAIAKPAIDLAALKIDFSKMTGFLQLSRAFEDTGASAYTGAAPLIKSKEILKTAAQILGTEIYHATNIRLMIAQMGIPTTKTDSEDVLPPPSGTDYFCDHKALAVSRTAKQVIAIVAPFFPDGLNGVIT
jgi:hypothetical protein